MIKKCIRCGAIFEYKEEDTFFDYKGSYYDTKLVKCKECGNANILYYYYYQLDYNNDERYYDMRNYWEKEHTYINSGICIKRSPLQRNNNNKRNKNNSIEQTNFKEQKGDFRVNGKEKRENNVRKEELD